MASEPSVFSQPVAISAERDRPQALSAGCTVGPWRVEQRIHDGADPVRYAVVHIATSRAAVLEVMNTPGIAHLEHMKVVAQDIARVRHSGVVRVHDTGLLPDGYPYVIRDVIDGATLGELARGAPPTLLTLLVLASDIVDILVAAHAAGVVHGSLTLDRVLVRRGAALKLLDWGMSRTSDAPSAASADDVLALGMMLTQLLREPVPAPLQDLVVAMTASDPARRPSIDAIAWELSAIRDDIDHPTASARELPAAKPVRLARDAVASAVQLRRALLVVGCLATLVLLARGTSDTADRADTRSAPDTSIASPTRAATVTPPERDSETETTTPSRTVADNEPPTVLPDPRTDNDSHMSERREVTLPKQAKPPRVSPARDAREATTDRALFLRYQRVGRQLMLLQRETGYMQVADLSARFRAIKLDSATASPQARQDATKELVDLERAIERNRPIEISDECRNNPLAAACL